MLDPYDYSRYSLEQLLDAQAHINRELYAERADEIDRWVTRRSSERAADNKLSRSLVSPAAAKNDPSPLLMACGLAALVGVAVAASLVILLVVRARGEDSASKRAAVHVVSAFTRDWDAEQLRQTGSEEFRRAASTATAERAFRTFRQLGPIKSLGEPVGGPKATAGIGSVPSGITAEYSFPAKFSNGDATIRVTLIRENGHWKTTGFFVDSDVFLAK